MVKKKDESISFEQSMGRLEAIVKQLEEGKVELDDAMALYKEGLELSKKCHEKLNTAEEQVAMIMTPNGEEPFKVEGEA